jgi:hypothetical protein
MADHGNVEYATAPGNDYDMHESTYEGFIKLTKWSIGIIVVVLILMAYFLT